MFIYLFQLLSIIIALLRNFNSAKMWSTINSPNSPIPCKLPAKQSNKPKFKPTAFSSFCSQSQMEPISTNATTRIQLPKTGAYTVQFKSLEACKLGISRYPDFEYDAHGGTGTGTGTGTSDSNDEVSVSFDLKTLFVPPLTTATTKFLGLPLPPFLRIDIVPELFQGSIHRESGKVDLEFKAKFLFSVGSVYRAPPLMVVTLLTTEESKGKLRGGRGERLDGQGRCRLVGVATVEAIDDAFMNSFLALPTECLADLNATISYSAS